MAESDLDDIERAVRQSEIEAMHAENAQVSEAIMRSHEAIHISNELDAAHNPNENLSSETSSWKSSELTHSSENAVVRPGRVQYFAIVSMDDAIRSRGVLGHPDSCWPCVRFIRGQCARGSNCHRCHAHDVAPSTGSGGARQRRAKQKASIRRIRTPDPYD